MAMQQDLLNSLSPGFARAHGSPAHASKSLWVSSQLGLSLQDWFPKLKPKHGPPKPQTFGPIPEFLNPYRAIQHVRPRAGSVEIQVWSMFPYLT